MFKKSYYRTLDPSYSPRFYEDPRDSEPQFDPEKLTVESFNDEKYISYDGNELAILGNPTPEDVESFGIKDPLKIHAFLMVDSQEALPLDTNKRIESIKDSEALDLFEEALKKKYHVLDLAEWVMDIIEELEDYD